LKPLLVLDLIQFYANTYVTTFPSALRSSSTPSTPTSQHGCTTRAVYRKMAEKMHHGRPSHICCLLFSTPLFHSQHSQQDFFPDLACPQTVSISGHYTYLCTNRAKFIVEASLVEQGNYYARDHARVNAGQRRSMSPSLIQQQANSNSVN
jgi:hypothetical protein